MLNEHQEVEIGMEYQQDLRNLASNKNGPQVIYQKLLLEIERLASISNPKNEDDEIEAVRQQAFEVLSTIKNKIEENIISLEKNTDWNTFTIAFYGETGAGKSTLIETLRILMSEPSKVADRARFSSAQVQLKNLGAKLQKNRNTEQKILNELETLKENLQDLEKNWVEQARKQESLQERGIEKVTNGLKNWFLFLFNSIGELKESESLRPQVELQAEEVDRKSKEVEIKSNEKKEVQLTIASLESQKIEVVQVLDEKSDGKIIGDGRSDFTQVVGEYQFEVDDKKFAILDLPGILGNEKEVQTAIDEGVEKAHVVFYVSKQPNPPQKGDEKSLGAIEKISHELSKHSEIYFLYNKPVRNPNSLKEELISDEDQNALKGVDKELSDKFSDVYEGHKTISAYPAFVALGYFYGGKNLKSQKNFLEKFSDTPKLLELSQVSQFSKWLTTDLVDNVKDKIKKSNYKKVTILLTETNDEVHRIYKSYSDLSKKNLGQLKFATDQLDQIEQSFKQKIEDTFEKTKRNFEQNVRQKLYDDIEKGLDAKTLKQELQQTIKSETDDLKKSVEKQIDVNLKEFSKEIEDVVSKYNIYLQENYKKMSINFNKSISPISSIKEFEFLGVEKAFKDLLRNIGLAVGGIVLAFFTGGAELIVVVPAIIGALANIALPVIKLVGIFSPNHVKSLERKYVNANLSTTISVLDSKLKKVGYNIKNKIKETTKNIESELDKSIQAIDTTKESYKAASNHLIELRNQIENGEL